MASGASSWPPALRPSRAATPASVTVVRRPSTKAALVTALASTIASAVATAASRSGPSGSSATVGCWATGSGPAGGKSKAAKGKGPKS